jgi:membrane-associated phospholipid phosphatase
VLSLWSRVAAAPASWVLCTALGGGLYLTVAGLAFGVRVEQVLVAALAVAAVAWGPSTRRLFIGVLPVALAGIAYDLSRLLQPLLVHATVHVVEPYHFDRMFFGIGTTAGVLVPNEIFLRHHAPAVDLLTGTAYILYLWQPVVFTLYLASSRRDAPGNTLLARFGCTFIAVNLAGLATYYLYPAAPPWYFATHDAGPVDLTTPANAAAALRWDALTGIPYFAHFYARGATVFGAIPSLHAAYPLMVWLYVRPLKNRGASIACFLFFLLVSFSAVYLQHHYVVDVLVAIAYVLIAYATERLITKVRRSRGSRSAWPRSQEAPAATPRHP